MEKTILIVDDDKSIISILEFILLQAGYNSISVTNRIDLLKTLNSNQGVDLVFLDLKLEEQPSIDILKEIVAKYPNLLVLLMSDYAQTVSLNEIFSFGAYGIIYKPFDVEEVLEVVGTIFKDKDHALCTEKQLG